jgi:trans-aconitate methyltransferase
MLTIRTLDMRHEFDGKKYENASAHQKEWGSKLVEELNLQGTERVLDLGCGDGMLTAKLAELVPKGEVVGIDASKGMIDTAQPRARQNLRFLLMDINELSFSEEFDVVFSNATLNWVKDHRRLCANVHRALRVGGRIRFNFAGDGNCSSFIKVIREAMSRDEFAAHFSAFEWPWYMPPVAEYSTLIESTSLRSVRVWGENADRFFPDEETMIRWIDQPSLVPFLVCVAAGAKESFRSFVVRRMVEETRQEDGRCFETFRRINVSATR